MWPLAVAFALGLVLALTGAWTPAGRAGQVGPIEALREASTERRAMTATRWVLGLACLAGAVPFVPLIRTPEGAAYVLLVATLLILGCAILAPALVRPLVRVLSAGARRPAGLLARHSALASVRRTASTAAPVLITIGLAGATLAGTATLSAAQARSVRDHVTAPLVVVPAGQAAMSDAVAAQAGRVSGVTAAVPVKQTFAFDRADAMVRQRTAWYIDGATATQAFRLQVATGRLADLTGHTVALSRTIADANGWTVGTQADLWLGDGAQVRLRVVATLEDRLGLPAVLLPWTLASAHSTLPLPDAVYLASAPGTNQADIDRTVRPLGGQMVPTNIYLSTTDAEFDRLNRLALLAIIGMALAYTAISIATTQFMATAGRRRELATLRLLGATPRQRLLIVWREAALVSAVGALLGAAVTAATLAAITAALNPVVSTVPIVIPWPPLIAITITCGLIAILASLAPAASGHRASAT
jgi:putative ABC transport system permease protein